MNINMIDHKGFYLPVDPIDCGETRDGVGSGPAHDGSIPRTTSQPRDHPNDP